MPVLKRVVEKKEASTLAAMLYIDGNFLDEFVRTCLPEYCRTGEVIKAEGFVAFVPFAKQGAWVMDQAARTAASARNSEFATKRVGTHGATEKSVREATEAGKSLLRRYFARDGDATSSPPYSKRRARDILHSVTGEPGEVTDERLDEWKERVDRNADRWLEEIRPFIYGLGTPMMESVEKAGETFRRSSLTDQEKVLLILSDGEPSDYLSEQDKEIIMKLSQEEPTSLTENSPLPQLKSLGVHVAGCFITDTCLDDPKCLYSIAEKDWSHGARVMFEISSEVTSSKIPRTLFVKRGWRVEYLDNRTKLFLQVNHPDLLENVHQLVREIILSQDALSDALASVRLDMDINRAIEGFEPQDQDDKDSCFAYAAGTAMHFAMKRMHPNVYEDGRWETSAQCPEFLDLRQHLEREYGSQGANTLRVLLETCPGHKLSCREVDEAGAKKAIAEKRPCVAKFRLTDKEWDTFEKFFEKNPGGVLTDKDLDIKKCDGADQTEGHAVVLMDFDGSGLRLMNSYGPEWGDGGFFRVSSAGVVGMTFVDVYWKEADLDEEDRRTWALFGSSVSASMVGSLEGLRTALSRCPSCERESPVVNFTGNLREAKCPRCEHVFDVEGTQGTQDLALNLFLHSLVITT